MRLKQPLSSSRIISHASSQFVFSELSVRGDARVERSAFSSTDNSSSTRAIVMLKCYCDHLVVSQWLNVGLAALKPGHCSSYSGCSGGCTRGEIISGSSMLLT